MAHLGDPVPGSLESYYRELDAGRMESAALRFSADVLYAIPWPGGLETDKRREIRGREELLAWFEERGHSPYTHEIQLCLVDGTSCLLEGIGVAETGDPFATFAASAQLDSDGLISRYLAYRIDPAVEPTPEGDEPSPADAAGVLSRYFHALDAGDFEHAADQFADDVVYSHPPYRHTGIDSDTRVVFRGRDELLAAFTARGRQNFGHDTLALRQHGRHCLLEGVVSGLADDGGGSFISSLSLDTHGRIARYVSFYCEPAVPRR